MTTLALGRVSIVVLAFCFVIVVAFSFVLGMVSEASSRVSGVETVAASPCVARPAPEAAAEGRSEEGGGEGSIGDRADKRARLVAEQEARRQVEGPLNFIADALREHLDLFKELFPADPSMNPALFLDKEIDEAKEKQDVQLQAALFADRPGDKSAMNAVEGEETGALPPVPTIGAAPVQDKASPVPATVKPAALPTVQLPAAAVQPGQSVYSIELGSFRSGSNAQSFAQTIQQRGYPVEIDEGKDAFAQDWYHVRLGRYSDSIEAAQHLDDFERRVGIGGVLVVLPPDQAAPASAAK